MKRLHIFCTLVLLLILLPVLSVSASEAESALFRAELTEVPEKLGDFFSVKLSPNRSDISAFVLRAEYDSAAVTQAKAELTGTVNKDYLTSLNEDGCISLVYTAADSPLPETGGIILRFRTDSTWSAENLSLRFEITDAADSSAKKLLSETESHTVEVSFPPLPSADCTLLSLTPPTGTLVPEFSPDILEYTLEVPFSYTSLTFDAVPADGATVRVNRKNLSAGGSTVDFRFTVTAADGATQTVYTVAVTRLEKETLTEEPSSSSSSSSTPVSADCTLLSLTPPTGTLVPEFSPDILEYTLEVPFSYTSLTFDAVPTDGASVRVNRKNLSAGGSTVDFHFTVTAADGSTQTVYTVAVTRLEKEISTEEPAASSSSPTSANKTSSTGTGKTVQGTSNGSASSGSGDTPAESSEVSSAYSIPSSTSAPNIYIYPESGTDPTTDRLVTAAIVLLSVCVGVGIACFLQALLSKAEKHTDDPNKKDN